MTFDDFMSQVLSNFPNAEVTEDDDGQLVIHTNLRMDNGNVVPFEDDENA
jgi:hypothetical protein